MNTVVLAHLTEQAEKARTEAAQLLAEDRQNKQKIALQLQTLQQYRNDYAEQLQHQMKQGMASHLLNNYRQFLGSLDHAITRAQDALLDQQQKVDSSQQHWMTKQRKLASYETLSDRKQVAAQRVMNKREQKMADELSLAMYMRQRAPR